MAKKRKNKYSKFRTKVLTILLFTGVAPLLITALVSLSTVIKTRGGRIWAKSQLGKSSTFSFSLLLA